MLELARESQELAKKTHDEIVELKGDLVTKVETLWSDMYNGGKEGVKTQLTQLVTKLDQRDLNQEKNDKEREKRQARRDTRTNFILVIIGLIIALIGALHELPPAVDSLKKFLNGGIHYPHLFHGNNDGSRYTGRMNRQPESSVLPDSEVRNALTVNSQGEQTQDIF
jgi:hypothetical protein